MALPLCRKIKKALTNKHVQTLQGSIYLLLSGLILYLVVSRITATNTKSDRTRISCRYQKLSGKKSVFVIVGLLDVKIFTPIHVF